MVCAGVVLSENNGILFTEDLERVSFVDRESAADLFGYDQTAQIVHTADDTSSFHFQFLLNKCYISVLGKWCSTSWLNYRKKAWFVNLAGEQNAAFKNSRGTIRVYL